MTKEAEVFEAVLLVIRRRPPCMKIVSVLVDPDLSEELDGQRRPAQLGRDLAAPSGVQPTRPGGARQRPHMNMHGMFHAHQLPQRAVDYVVARRGFRVPSYTIRLA